MTSAEHDRVVPLQKFPEPVAGATPLVVEEGTRVALGYPAAGGWKIASFPRCEAFRVTASTTLRGCHEILGSLWARDVARSTGAALRHLVFGFGDSTFECVVPRWNDEEASGSAEDIVELMRASLRHDDVPALELVDQKRGRTLPTWLYRAESSDAPLVVFAHGWFGHPRKFKRLLRAWADAGFTVAAPAFPLTNDESPYDLETADVANQPRDVAFVADQVAAEGQRFGVAGFSLGGLTALGIAFNTNHRDRRVSAVVSMASGFYDWLGGTYEMTETPLLVVHGTEDYYEKGLEVYEAARGPKQLLALEGGGHDIAQDSSPHLDQVIEASTAFWREYL